MDQTVDEKIDAYVIYPTGAPYPLLRAFRWRNRRFDVTGTHLVYPEHQGQTKLLCYAVSCGSQRCSIRFDTRACHWVLTTIEIEE